MANDFEQRLLAISNELSGIDGPLEVHSRNLTFILLLIEIHLRQAQEQQVHEIQLRIPALSSTLSTVAQAEAECNAANVEENDYTVFTCQDLEFELELVVHSIAKKITFIDNQVCLDILFLFSTTII